MLVTQLMILTDILKMNVCLLQYMWHASLCGSGKTADFNHTDTLTEK